MTLLVVDLAYLFKECFCLPTNYDDTDLEAKCISNLDGWMAMKIRWMSPLTQVSEFEFLRARPHRSLHLRVVGVRDSSGEDPVFKSVLEVAARDAFWPIPMLALKRMARERGIAEVSCNGKLAQTTCAK